MVIATDKPANQYDQSKDYRYDYLRQNGSFLPNLLHMSTLELDCALFHGDAYLLARVDQVGVFDNFPVGFEYARIIRCVSIVFLGNSR